MRSFILVCDLPVRVGSSDQSTDACQPRRHQSQPKETLLSANKVHIDP